MRAFLTAGRRWLPAVALGMACAAQAAPPNDPMAWLRRAVEASRTTNYAGTYVHTNGERTSTLRVSHVFAGGVEHERIDALDGPAYEIVRRNDEMFCYFPDAKTVRLDQRVNARFFPALFRAPAETIASEYEPKLGAIEHVLTHECRWIDLEPKDSLRFAEHLCSEVGSGLVVRAKTYNGRGRMLEQYTFTELRMGSQVPKGDAKSIFEARVKQWITDAQPREEAKAVDTGWTVTNLPAGFQKVTELRRTLPGRSEPVSQLIFSDGLASLSVFVEPNSHPARSTEASSEDGSTTFYVHPMGDNLVTVLGEVPLAAAQQVGRSVAHRP